MKINVEMVENEILALMSTNGLPRLQAKYDIWSALVAEDSVHEFEEGAKELVLQYLSPTRVLH
jgi:hypothetical protein